MTTWRDHARPIIERVILDNPGLSEKELRKLISAEYPFGLRQYHPYKIWCDEVNVQLGKKKPKQRKKGEPVKKPPLPCEGQQDLF